MPRCCEQIPAEFDPSYASVTLLGGTSLRDKVAELEARPITPCFTAWCPRCSRAYLLTTDLASFPSPSAHHAHRLALLAGLSQYIN